MTTINSLPMPLEGHTGQLDKFVTGDRRGSGLARSNSRLLSQIEGVLSTSAYVNDRQFSVQERDGRVKLEGTVGSFFVKQMAQEVLRRVDGVEQIENQLKVEWR